MDKDIIDIIKTPDDMKAMHIIYNEYAKVLAKKEADFWFTLYEALEKKDNVTGFKVSYKTDGEIIDYKNIVIVLKLQKGKLLISQLGI